MKKITFILLLFLCQIGVSQEICLAQEFTIIIEDTSNVPTVTDNSDNTVMVVHPEQYITDIFANYKVYSFGRMFPEETSGTLTRWYKLECESRALVNELDTDVPSDIMATHNYYENYSISQELRDFFDGQRFRFSEYNSTADGSQCTIDCPLDPVPNDFDLLVDRSYDAQNDELVMTTTHVTPCGTEFRFSLRERSSTEGEGLILWTSEKQPCFDPYETDNCFIENVLYQSFFSNGFPTDIEIINNEDFKLTSPNAIFGEHNVLFTRETLSVDRFSLEKEIQIHPNPIEDRILIQSGQVKIEKVTVFNILGKQVAASNQDTKNIDVSQLKSGVYLCRIESEKGILSKKIIKK